MRPTCRDSESRIHRQLGRRLQTTQRAVGDFLDTMRFRQIDILGYQAGTLIAAEMAIARPKQIRRLVMVSVPVLNDAERDAFRRGSSAAVGRWQLIC